MFIAPKKHLKKVKLVGVGFLSLKIEKKINSEKAYLFLSYI